MSKRRKTRAKARAAGYRSKFEQDVFERAKEEGIEVEYEPKEEIIEYFKKPSKYLPDGRLPNGVLVECKGRFTVFDRVKHLLIKEQHPEKDIRFVFQYNNTLSKKSKTTYTEWCDKHGFMWAIGDIPHEWL